MKVSESIYAEMINDLRETYKRNGATLFHSPDDYGINKYYPSENGDILLVFYYTSLDKVKTPQGTIVPLGGYSCSGASHTDKKSLAEFMERYGLELVSDESPRDWRKGERWITYRATKNIPTVEKK